MHRPWSGCRGHRVQTILRISDQVEYTVEDRSAPEKSVEAEGEPVEVAWKVVREYRAFAHAQKRPFQIMTMRWTIGRYTPDFPKYSGIIPHYP